MNTYELTIQLKYCKITSILLPVLRPLEVTSILDCMFVIFMLFSYLS